MKKVLEKNFTFIDFLAEGNLGQELKKRGITGSGVPEETGKGMPTSVGVNPNPPKGAHKNTTDPHYQAKAHEYARSIAGKFHRGMDGDMEHFAAVKKKFPHYHPKTEWGTKKDHQEDSNELIEAKAKKPFTLKGRVISEKKISNVEWSKQQHFVHGKGGVLFGDKSAISKWNKLYSAEHGEYKPKKIISMSAAHKPKEKVDTNCVAPSEGGAKLNEAQTRKLVVLSKGGAKRRLHEIGIPKFISKGVDYIKGKAKKVKNTLSGKSEDNSTMKRWASLQKPKPKPKKRPIPKDVLDTTRAHERPPRQDNTPKKEWETDESGTVTSQSPGRYGKTVPKNRVHSRDAMEGNVAPQGLDVIMEKLGKELSKYKKTRPEPQSPARTEPRSHVEVPKGTKLSTKAQNKLEGHEQRKSERRESDTYWAKDYQGGGDSEDRRVKATRERLGKHYKSRGEKKVKGEKVEAAPKPSKLKRLEKVQMSHLKRKGGVVGGDDAIRSSTTKQIAQTYADKRGGSAEDHMDTATKKKAKAEATRGKKLNAMGLPKK